MEIVDFGVLRKNILRLIDSPAQPTATIVAAAMPHVAIAPPDQPQ
jgi:hypothetical protein